MPRGSGSYLMRNASNGKWPTRFQTLAATMMAAASTGSSYTFGTYSKALKLSFGFSQTQIETISVACFSMGFFTFLPGMLGDRLRASICIKLGGLLQASSFLLFWAFSTTRLGNNNLPTDKNMWILSGLSMLQFMGSAMITGVVFSSMVKNFPNQRGSITGLIKGWVGLASGLLTTLFIGFMNPDLSHTDDPSWLNFSLLAGIAILCSSFIPSFFVKVHDNKNLSNEQEKEVNDQVVRRVNVGYCILVVMGTTVITSALIQDSVSNRVMMVFSSLVVVIWLSPTLLALDFWGPFPKYSSNTVLLLHKNKKNPQAPPLQTTIIVDMNTKQMFQTRDFYLLLYGCVAIVGAGSAVTTNVGQMFDSIHSEKNVQASVFFSATQSFSRVACGFLCDVLVRKRLPRSCIVLGALLVMIGGYMSFYVNTELMLLVGTVLSGFAFGAIWPSMVVIVSEVFGLRNLGGNYMVFDGVSSAVGSLIFGKFIPEYFYEKEKEEGETDCYGKDCYRMSYLLITGILCTAVGSTVVLIRRQIKCEYLTN